MKKPGLVCAICVMAVWGPLTVQAAILYGHGSCMGLGITDEQRETLYRIDTTQQTVTALGRETDRNCASPEVQIDQAGEIIYMPAAWSGVEGVDMFLVNPVDGLNTGSLDMTGYPVDTTTITALEFVGSILYGSAHEAGPESYDGVLVTIDTTTGIMTEIGIMAGMDKPTGGMSYVNGTMYAISSTNSEPYASLFTVDLGTGATTKIADIIFEGIHVNSATALAYADGKMYLLLNRGSNLYSIDLTTGQLTLEFDMGVVMNSLTGVNAASGVIGDLDGSNSVDKADLSILMSHNGQDAADCPACDLNDDGTIDVLDIRQLIIDNPSLTRDRSVRRQARKTSRRSRRH